MLVGRRVVKLDWMSRYGFLFMITHKMNSLHLADERGLRRPRESAR